ncbi:hypothetical protein J056_000396 [Wallemia ichthyophaga EXF-994]|uniref:Major facilitator superfamily (MFS) profile domain-containing protein n=1 Tax=Wallemia ichthyophaga (strain EXF-994 / CBS 113033) TaxID=1299270 RepID=R9AR30_WALI9|nr:uncharacterized protein J056_000396 [Wallemia ichthyophaga EXF-994]TIA70082.1 hypothetical protein E3P91_03276 [Wallemia ichthyophaga]EOR04643.1 hypothetical protein J056_000396 [Wallemia ichthyophaga EXF-994]TIB36673.1 hypothetical protein E3P84_00722 [Wallemia ichthyophaga]TIB43066.1 hypothetical protein E3P83_00971 [Wallemia ichthyophaga]TIB60256.1 hypothetical protein E3P78_03196 [Wallemia ichthyophaga]
MSIAIRADEPIAVEEEVNNINRDDPIVVDNMPHIQTKSKPSQVYYLWPCYGLYAMAVGMTFAPNLEVRSKIICEGYNTPNCQEVPSFKNDVADLTIKLSLITGILACLTTPYWSSLSDKIGRLPVITLTSAGYFICNAINAYVSTRLNPSEMYLLYVSAAFDGISGSQSTVMAISHAYASDCTDNGSRAHVFSQLMGVLFLGVAAGPALATFVTRYTRSFEHAFIAAAVASILMLVISLIIPESLPKQKKEHIHSQQSTHSMHSLFRTPSVLDNFKKPFSILAPRTDPDDKSINVNLLALSVAYFPIVLAIGAVQIKFLYTKFRFDWDVSQLGTFIAYIGTVRALALLVVIPTTIKTLRRYLKPAVELPTTTIYEDEDEDTINEDLLAKYTDQGEIKFDLVLLRVCLIADSLAYVGLALSGNIFTFAAFSAVSALGGGANPAAISSLALLLSPNKSESSGAVLGAFSSVQSAGAQIIGPALYGLIYSHSPNSLFLVVIGSTFFISLAATFFVKYC